MPSRIVTPPDHLPTKKNILIINALDTELATLVLWLKTVPDEYDIHLYHSQMPEDAWVKTAIDCAAQVLVSQPEVPALNAVVKDLINANNSRIIYFGKNTEYPDLIQYFLANQQLQV